MDWKTSPQTKFIPSYITHDIQALEEPFTYCFYGFYLLLNRVLYFHFAGGPLIEYQGNIFLNFC